MASTDLIPLSRVAFLQALMAAVSAAPGSTGAAGGAGVGVAVVSFFFFLFFIKGTPGPAQGEVWAGAAGVIR